MIKIDSYFDDIPDELSKATEKCDFPNDSKEVKSAIYGKARPKLLQFFKKKCSYCEINISGGAYYHVEHYRPKGNKEKENKGYYWLGYEWSNFLLACPHCNGKKNDAFPILDEKNRLKTPPKDANGKIITLITDDVYRNEHPLLLHPVLDGNLIDKHISFDKSGFMKVENSSPRGQKSIECYDLNRQELILNRAKIITEDIVNKMIICEYRLAKMALNEDKITEILNLIIMNLKNEIKYETKEFIGFRKAILKNLLTFVIKNPVVLKAKNSRDNAEKVVEIPQQDLWIKCLNNLNLDALFI